MLTVRQAQFAVLSQWEVQKFEDWMLAHLKKFFPKQSDAAGDRQLRKMVRYGIERAAGYKIRAKSDVCKYIDLMVVFGRDFDTDDRSPWAAKILSKRTSSNARMRDLIETGKKRLRRP